MSATLTATALQVATLRQAGGGADLFSAGVINIADINSGKWKSVFPTGVAAWSSTDGWVEMNSGNWRSQAPITEIDLTTSSGFSAGTRIDLFGILPRMVA